MKKFFFKTCPNTGRIRGLRNDSLIHKLLFPAIGVTALAWVIFRVVPKPSRATYPCQQAAIPLAVTFLGWLGATTVGVALLKFARREFTNKRIMVASLVAVIGILFFVGAQFLNNISAKAQDTGVFKPLSDTPNVPIGTAKGINPGRVTWVRDIAATPWDGKTGKWDGTLSKSFSNGTNCCPLSSRNCLRIFSDKYLSAHAK